MSPLDLLIRAEIARDGPIDVARLMAVALFHPQHGYYTTREPFGVGGDFITAPEISQMFGEMLGLWAADCWQRMGAPASVALVELGPGRGTLMADMLRAARILPPFAQSLRPHLVEASPRLADIQRATLAGHDAVWHGDAATLPSGPAIVLANEFFDALPIRQFEKRGGRWHERLVGCDGDRLAFRLAPGGADPAHPRAILDAAPDGAVVELCPAAGAVVAGLAAPGRVVLAIDYGAPSSGTGDTLQALRSHAPTDPLARLGEVDLTAQVDFGGLSRAAAAAGFSVFGPVGQGAFLDRLGLAARAQALAARHPAKADRIAADHRRLTAPEAMGTLFQAIAFSTVPGLTPAGF